ncbi:hypothetical protein [Pseudomonas neuropathica]|uniref:hypothetical protein n=1 Tax=Pseudomonas neuropathica TaxID=2730425 RepID=UPI003EBE29DD
METHSTIDIQSDDLIEVFKLFPVFIPGWLTPVRPSGLAHGGVPRRLFTGTPESVRCVVDPWTELLNRGVAALAEYDSVALFINDGATPVDSHTVEPGEENKRVALYAPKSKFVNGINKLHYVVERLGGNNEKSEILSVLYHLHPHANFKLIIPSEVIANGITPELAQNGVKFEMRYTTKEPFDQVILKLGNATFTVDVTDPLAPVSKTLYTADFENFADGEINVNFEVTDQLGQFGESPNETMNIRLKEKLPAPTLTNVLDANNTEVPEGASTTSTTLVLKGTASKGKDVELFDGNGASAVPKGIATADEITGRWERAIDVVLGARRLYAQSRYHPTPTYSNVRHASVIENVAPSIDSVKGSPSGVEIPQGGVTVETAVTLSGVAAKGQKVEISDGTVSKGPATADPTTGVWTLLVSALTLAAHSFTAKALYGSGATSAARTLTVVQNIVPELRLITDSALVEIPNNGQTIHTTIILSGIAGPGTVIDLVNYGAPLPNTNIQVDAKGTWTFQLIGLSVGTTYNLRARRKGGSVSNARNVMVVAAVVATLDNVLDDKGVEVPQNQTTVSTTLKLKGTASPGQKVEIFDGNGASAVSKGVATAHATTGIWEHSITVALGARRLYAKALYAVNPVFSNVRNLTVTTATAPTLTSAKGSPSGVEIPQAGVTVETAVTLSGVAAKGQKVEIFAGTDSKGPATAHATTGVWTLLVSALAVAAHSFTAKALYGSGAVSAARTLTVTAAIAPTLTSVKGSPSGVEIPQAGVTVETAVTLSGVAAKGQKVEIFAGTDSKGPATAHATTGVWTLLVSALAVAAHSFTAKALYGSNPVSAARTFTVAVATAPTIASVKGTLSGRDIPRGGTTAELAVTLRGIAAKGLKVEVFDHAVFQREATVDGATGEWTINVNGLGRVEHSFKVKALYGTRPESAPWNFTVLKAIHIPQGRLLIGQSISTETCRITFLHQNQVNCYIDCEHWRIFPYVPYSPGSITYQLDFIGQTTERVNLKANGGNILGPTTITFAFLNSSGATMGTISKTINRWAEYHLIDSGRLPGIASVRITVTGQIYITDWEFGKVP